MQPIELHNKTRYVSESLVRSCFTFGSHNYVDKVVCGNGFSTAFLKLKPEPGKQHIMIAPNKAVVVDKEQQFVNGGLETSNRIVFVYGGSRGRHLWKEADVIVFVVDSFLREFERFDYNDVYLSDISLMLIDESHSAEIQASFRRSLKRFTATIDKYFLRTSAVVSVTATPNLSASSLVTHRVINSHIQPMEVVHTNNQRETINRVKSDIEAGNPVVVATNSGNILAAIANRTRLEANFIVGESLMRTIVERFEVVHNPESNVTIISSRGFEGYDVYGADYNVYYFEDRSDLHNSFYIANLYQAINRTRDGAKYIEYCRIERSDVSSRTLIKRITITNFVHNTKLSPEEKLKNKYKARHPYISHVQDKEGHIEIFFDSVAHDLLLERIEFDKGFNGFQDFLADRLITITPILGKQKRLGISKFSDKHKVAMLQLNSRLITKLDLFGDEFRAIIQDNVGRDIKKQYFKNAMDFLRKKNYKGDYILADRQHTILELLQEPPTLVAGRLAKLVKSYKTYYLNKAGRSIKERAKAMIKITAFENRVHLDYFKILIMFLNEEVRPPRNQVANRDYNLVTLLNLEITIIIAGWLGVQVTEIDIKSCFPRILYAINGLELPSDFYGSQKQHKVANNVVINQNWYNRNNDSPHFTQKQNSKRRLEKQSFAPVVIDYLLNEFFDKPYKGDLFNFLAWHERRIISRVKSILEFGDGDGQPGVLNNSIGWTTRHDSVIVFGDVDNYQFLTDFEYLNIFGWFDFKSKVRTVSYEYENEYEF